MSKEIMAECLEEAAQLFGHAAWDEDGVLGAAIGNTHEGVAIATIAAALYHERMKARRQLSSPSTSP